MKFFDYEKCEKFLAQVCRHYLESAPTVSEYADDVYRRLTSGGAVQLDELTTLQALWSEEWEHPNFAANRIYKLQSSLGMDVTGQAGF
jgi:hypothetical protein